MECFQASRRMGAREWIENPPESPDQQLAPSIPAISGGTDLRDKMSSATEKTTAAHRTCATYLDVLFTPKIISK